MNYARDEREEGSEHDLSTRNLQEKYISVRIRLWEGEGCENRNEKTDGKTYKKQNKKGSIGNTRPGERGDKKSTKRTNKPTQGRARTTKGGNGASELYNKEIDVAMVIRLCRVGFV